MNLRSKKPNMPEDTIDAVPTAPQPNLFNIKFPIFNSESPETYFKVVEAYKTAYNLKETDLFLNCFVNLPPNVQAMVKHLLDPDATNQIAEFKKIIETNFIPPIEDRIKKLILSSKIGDSKPSEYLRQIKNVIGENWTAYEKLIRSQFLDSLASNIAPFIHLIAPTTDLESIALAADKSWTQQKMNLNKISADSFLDQKIDNISAKLNTLSHNNPIQDLNSIKIDFETKFITLTEELKRANANIERLKQSLDKLWTKSRDISRNRQNFNRSRSRDRGTYNNQNSQGNDMCHFHKRFGANAFRCVPPCGYSQYTTSQGNVVAPSGQQV